MEPQSINSSSPELLKDHFLHHLNRVYYGKQYLKKHLPELTEVSSFNKLKQAIQEVCEDVSKQVNRIQEIYTLLGAQPAQENCVPIIAVFKDAFEPQDYKDETCLLNDIDIILYLQLLEHINITSYRMLEILAVSMGKPEVEQLLLESFDESSDNDKLFVMIADEYVTRTQNKI
jgi:ferritin-like metal-binding protein YciE